MRLLKYLQDTTFDETKKAGVVCGCLPHKSFVTICGDEFPKKTKWQIDDSDESNNDDKVTCIKCKRVIAFIRGENE
ncbi:MAG: hypothetical protein FWB90_03940 [Fibromonadales bacterium]|nr:hypothetical protein [Fibromonadales bacterium]